MTSIPDRAGRFRAYPVEWSVKETGKNNLCTFVCTFRMSEWWDEAKEEWWPWADYDHRINGYFFIEKKDGSPNEFTINSLRDVFGWDGTDLEALQETNWEKHGVQLTLEYEEFGGKTRLKVQWLNDWDNTGGGSAVEKSPLDSIKVMQGRLGSSLRAIAPPVSHNSAPPSGRPKPPATPPAARHAAVAESDIPFVWLAALGTLGLFAQGALQVVV